MSRYADDFDPGEQVDAEEDIAAIIFDHPGVEVSEEDAADLGREILLVVLSRFRPDLLSPEGETQ